MQVASPQAAVDGFQLRVVQQGLQIGSSAGVGGAGDLLQVNVSRHGDGLGQGFQDLQTGLLQGWMGATNAVSVGGDS